jgi:hypothetical protein
LRADVIQGKLEEIYESLAPAAADGSSSRGAAKQLQQLALRYSLPQELIEKVGAPPVMWSIIRLVGYLGWYTCGWLTYA